MISLISAWEMLVFDAGTIDADTFDAGADAGALDADTFDADTFDAGALGADTFALDFCVVLLFLIITTTNALGLIEHSSIVASLFVSLLPPQTIV
jgi:hypothetical protein